jgi:hypothetical protein
MKNNWFPSNWKKRKQNCPSIVFLRKIKPFFCLEAQKDRSFTTFATALFAHGYPLCSLIFAQQAYMKRICILLNKLIIFFMRCWFRSGQSCLSTINYVARVRMRVSYPIRCECGDMKNLKNFIYEWGYI